MDSTPTTQRHLVVVGGGMVAQRLVEALRERDRDGAWRVTVIAEEPRLPYDRVALTSYFTGKSPEDLVLGDPELWNDPLVRLRKGTAATAVDPGARTVTLPTVPRWTTTSSSSRPARTPPSHPWMART